jgi:xanthine dehydrogenase accessory factor
VGRAAGGRGDRIADDPVNLLSAYAAAGTPCVLATVVRVEAPTSAHPGDKAVITADGRLQGWVGGSCSEPLVKREALRALAEGTPRLVRIIGDAGRPQERRRSGELTMGTTCPSGGSLDIFIEPRLPKPLLMVFGGSPAAHALLQMGALAGFRTCAVHPGARADEFPGADVVFSDFDLAPAAIGADSWAVVASMGHYDEEALEAALAHPELEVALVASARRSAAVRAVLRERGLPAATLARIRTPAGQARGATQEEIALFALADLVLTRRRAAPRRQAAAPVEAEAPRFALDPVCGMTVQLPARHELSVGGESYAFCCAGCQQSFEAEPSRYLSQPAGAG